MTQTECLEELYPQFIGCGYSPLLFEELSPAEIVDMINGYVIAQDRKNELRQVQVKQTIDILDGTLIALLHNLVSVLPGNESVEAISLRSLFPGVFPKEEPASKLSADMQIYKANRIHAAYQFNEKRRKEGG